MESNLTIRGAAVTDVETIVDYNARLARETEETELDVDTLRSGVARLVDDPKRGRYFLACAGERIVGQIMHTTEWSDWRDGEIWWIQSVYVHPDFRGRGVYRALHEHLARLVAETAGVVGLRLYVERDNRRAQDVYARMGMRPAGYLVMQDLRAAE